MTYAKNSAGGTIVHAWMDSDSASICRAENRPSGEPLELVSMGPGQGKSTPEPMCEKCLEMYWIWKPGGAP